MGQCLSKTVLIPCRPGDIGMNAALVYIIARQERAGRIGQRELARHLLRWALQKEPKARKYQGCLAEWLE